MNAVFCEIDKLLTLKGYCLIHNLSKFSDQVNLPQREILSAIVKKYHDSHQNQFMILCDVCIETPRQIVINTCSLRDIQKRQIQITPSTIFRFQANQVKEVKLLCVCLKQISIGKVIGEVRIQSANKSQKYVSPYKALEQKQPEVINLDDEDQQLPKRITRKKSNNRVEVELEPKQEIHKVKKLLLKDGSSDSEEYYFPRSSNEKLRNQDIQKQKEQKEHIGHTTAFHELKNETRKRTLSKQSLGSRSSSIDFPKKQNKHELKPKAQTKVKGKNGQQSKQQLQKQSTFMSNWFKNGQH